MLPGRFGASPDALFSFFAGEICHLLAICWSFDAKFMSDPSISEARASYRASCSVPRRTQPRTEVKPPYSPAPGLPQRLRGPSFWPVCLSFASAAATSARGPRLTEDGAGGMRRLSEHKTAEPRSAVPHRISKPIERRLEAFFSSLFPFFLSSCSHLPHSSFVTAAEGLFRLGRTCASTTNSAHPHPHIMSAISRSLRSASKLRVPSRSASGLCSASIGAGRFASAGFVAAATSAPAARSSFSTSIRKLSGAPAMPSSREYDPEIKDIADYVANKAIDSELAVSLPSFFFFGCAGEKTLPLGDAPHFFFLPNFNAFALATPPSIGVVAMRRRR